MICKISQVIVLEDIKLVVAKSDSSELVASGGIFRDYVAHVNDTVLIESFSLETDLIVCRSHCVFVGYQYTVAWFVYENEYSSDFLVMINDSN